MKLKHDSLALFLTENCSTEASTQRWLSSVNLPLLRVHLPTMLPRSSSIEFPSGPERLPCCCSLFGCGVLETLGGNTGRGDRTPANARNTSTRGCGLLTGKTGAKPITEVMIFHLHRNWHCASMCVGATASSRVVINLISRNVASFIMLRLRYIYTYITRSKTLLLLTTIAVAICLIPTCCTWSSYVLLDSSSLLDSQTVVCPEGNGGGNSESEHIFSPENGP